MPPSAWSGRDHKPEFNKAPRYVDTPQFGNPYLSGYHVTGSWALTGETLEGGEMDIYSLGANWWFTRSTHLSANYRYITLDRFGTQGNSSGLNVRILLMLD